MTFCAEFAPKNNSAGIRLKATKNSAAAWRICMLIKFGATAQLVRTDHIR